MFGQERLNSDKELEGDWMNLKSVTYKTANQISSLLVEPVGNSAVLNIGARGGN